MGLFSYIEEAFKRSFEEKCVSLLVSAYNTSITKLDYSIKWMENDFTSMLDRYINQNPQRLMWGWKIDCHVEHHLHKNIIQNKKGYANKEDRIDMKLTSISLGKEFCFYVEAKNLKEKDSKLLKRYIETGIDHYLTEKYPRGILLGYLVGGSVDTTIQKINALLTKKKRESEMLKRQSHSLHDQYFESTHPNFGVISHFVFDYTV
jgi:hypothetical protein